MSKRKPPSHEATTTAARTIAERRAEHHDPDLAQLPDPADLLALARYAVTRRRVPAPVVQADALAVLDMCHYLDAEIDRIRLRAVDAARNAGTTLVQLAAPLGVVSRRPDPDHVRAATWAAVTRLRAAVAAAQPTPAGPVPGGDEREATTGGQVREVLAELLAHRVELDDNTAEDLDWVADRLRSVNAGGPLPSVIRAALRDLLDDLAVVGGLSAPLRALVERADALLDR